MKAGGFSILNERFVRYLINLGSSKPGWTYILFNEIIGDSRITFIKDTTIIIHTRSLTINQATILFTILKELHKLLVIKKVLNKKEYLIVHCNSEVSMCFFNNPNKWMSLMVYDECLLKNGEFECEYFYDNYKWDLLIKKENKVIKLYTNEKNCIETSEKNCYFLGQNLNKNSLGRQFIKYSNNQDKIITEIRKLIG